MKFVMSNFDGKTQDYDDENHFMTSHHLTKNINHDEEEEEDFSLDRNRTCSSRCKHSGNSSSG